MAYKYKQFTNQELRAFEKEMNEKYLIKKVLSDGKEHQFYDEERWQKDNGGLGGLGGVIISDFRPIEYETNRDKLSQLYKLQGRTEFAKKQEMVALEKSIDEVSAGVQIDEPVDPLAF